MRSEEQKTVAREMVDLLIGDNPGVFVSSGTCGNRLRALTWWLCGLGVLKLLVAGAVVVLLVR